MVCVYSLTLGPYRYNFTAYYHVPIDSSHTKYLCFISNGQIYQFVVLCFGIKLSLYTFKAVRMFFSLNGVTIIIYIDGILVLADTSKDCIKDFQFVIDTLIKLGFHIKREKCILQLSQHFFFLGYLYQGALHGNISQPQGDGPEHPETHEMCHLLQAFSPFDKSEV